MAFRSSSSRSDARVITLVVAAACLAACATGVEGMTDGAGSGGQDANITLRDGGGDASDAASGSTDAGIKDASVGDDATGPALDASPGAPDVDGVDTSTPGEPDASVDADMPAPDGGGGPVEQDAATTPDASDAAAEVDAGQPDAALPPVNCDALVRTGVQLCDKTADTCGVVFTNRAGCTATCAAGGLSCAMGYENVEQQCARDDTRPAIACDSGHESDYCLCRRP
jgi:hypothetical protein